MAGIVQPEPPTAAPCQRPERDWCLELSTTLGLVAVVVLVLANGFFVATEFAIVAVRKSRLEQLAAEGAPNELRHVHTVSRQRVLRLAGASAWPGPASVTAMPALIPASGLTISQTVWATGRTLYSVPACVRETPFPLVRAEAVPNP